MTHATRQYGYTLLEVLVAIAILAVALTVTASLFPAAALLQKQAVDDAEAFRRARTAESMLSARNLDHDLLWNFLGSPTAIASWNRPSANPNLAQQVWPLAEIDIVYASGNTTPQAGDLIPNAVVRNYANATSPGAEVYYNESYLSRWPETDRAMPSFATPQRIDDPLFNVASPGDRTPIPVDLSDRDTFWVPMVQRGPEASESVVDWRVFVFLMQPEDIGDTFLNAYGRDAVGALDTSPAINLLQTNAFEFDRVANPWDSPAFPKVCFIEASLDDREGAPVQFLTITGASNVGNVMRDDPNNAPALDAGDLVLGDNGAVYRVAQRSANDPNELLVTVETPSAYEDDDLGLTGVWYARRDEPGAASPTRKILLMSRKVVQP
ncbi:MAG: type II secretion system protein [Planctomycetota bacterium]